ncbi:hypothetical protein P8C59_007428 [Phyllachora maydis]|uniref:Uncharacterized protein n=1 Tax=Phyllachora maydis TaxID=1825666 RepID=A0AAD9I912_9PEZI|nr:hypothetical protein P8C59_007428 [Phyllachora maydis]
MLLHLEKQEDVRKLQFPHLATQFFIPSWSNEKRKESGHNFRELERGPFSRTSILIRPSDTIIENGSVLQPSEAIAKFCIINPDTGDEVACRTAVALTFVNIILFLSINLLRQKPLLSLQL